MEFVDKALARRLEAAEELPQVYIAQLYQKLRPELGAEVEEICGGHMVFAGIGSPTGRAVGMGLNGPVSAADLDRVEQFYRKRGTETQVDVCPLTDLGLLELLKARGYAMAELNNVLYRFLRHDEDFTSLPPTGIELRAAAPEQAELWARVVGLGFHEGQNPPPAFQQMVAPSCQIPNAIPFLAWAGDRAVGAAVGFLMRERTMVALSGDATLPEYRRQGIQSALVRIRLKLAAEAGCDLAVAVTQGGTTSQRNYERLGFRVAYSKATLVRNWEKT